MLELSHGSIVLDDLGLVEIADILYLDIVGYLGLSAGNRDVGEGGDLPTRWTVNLVYHD